VGDASIRAARQVPRPQVRAWWPRHDIVALSSGTKRLRHPILGDLNLEHVELHLADDPEQKLVTFTADRTQQQRTPN
jgi:hypothetical protein